MVYTSSIDNIRFYVVQIKEGVYGKALGSGVLWVPSQNKDVYVFTSEHVLCTQEHEYTAAEISAHILSPENNLERIFHVSEIFYSASKNAKHRDGPLLDLAVLHLAIENSSLPSTNYGFLLLDDLRILYETNLLSAIVLCGFPSERGDQYAFPDRQLRLSCNVSNSLFEDPVTYRFITYLTAESSNRLSDYERELPGFSGGGIFVIVNDHVFLCGIHRGSPTNGLLYHDLSAVSVKGLIEVQKDNLFPTIPIAPLMPQDFLDLKNDCEAMLIDDETNCPHPIADLVAQLLCQNPYKIIQNSCSAFGECKYKQLFPMCQHFQMQYVLGCGLLAYENKEFPPEELLLIKSSNSSHPAYIICHDTNKRTAGSMVNSLIENLKQDELGTFNIQDNSLILWATKESCNHTRAVINKDQYAQIVPNIADANPFQNSIARVRQAPRDLTIVNITCAVDNMLEDSDSFHKIIETM